MVAFLSSFYGGTSPRYWLRTPIRTFFAMYKEGIKIEARRYSELADISLIANNMNVSYWEGIKRRYAKIIDPDFDKHPDEPGAFTLESGSKEAFKVLKDIGRKMRANLGYGR